MKGLLLISGGFDSPVAGHLMREKNVELTALHFSGQPFVNESAEKKAIKLAKLIGCKKLIIFPFGKIQAEVVNRCRHKYYFIITKRIMFEVAEKIAKTENCDFLITGDNLGQVGSQTLKNMAVINDKVEIKILQPLLSYDKQEIIDKAHEIGTHDASVGPEMCSALGPKHPATGAKKEKIEKEELRLDLTSLLKESFNNITVEDLK
jgi:thiamine biosynthesis protein ThiI